jgi:uncharacterized membrane protein
MAKSTSWLPRIILTAMSLIGVIFLFFWLLGAVQVFWSLAYCLLFLSYFFIGPILLVILFVWAIMQTRRVINFTRKAINFFTFKRAEQSHPPKGGPSNSFI